MRSISIERIGLILLRMGEFRLKLQPSDQEPNASCWEEWGAFLCAIQPLQHLMWIHAQGC